MNYLLYRKATPLGNAALHSINGMTTVITNRESQPMKAPPKALGTRDGERVHFGYVAARPGSAADQARIKPGSTSTPQVTASASTFPMPVR